MAENDKSIGQLPNRATLTGSEMIPFEEAGQNGYILSSLLKGQDEKDGKDGENGVDGATGPAGANGKSAYQLAVEDGYTGTEAKLAQALAKIPGIVTYMENTTFFVE